MFLFSPRIRGNAVTTSLIPLSAIIIDNLRGITSFSSSYKNCTRRIQRRFNVEFNSVCSKYYRRSTFNILSASTRAHDARRSGHRLICTQELCGASVMRITKPFALVPGGDEALSRKVCQLIRVVRPQT